MTGGATAGVGWSARDSATSGTSLDDFSDPTAWTGTLLTVAADSSDETHGSAVKLTTTSTSQSGTYAERTLAFDATDKFLTFWFKPLDGNFSQVGFALVVAGTSYSAKNFVKFALLNVSTSDPTPTAYANQWRRVTVPLGRLVAQGTAVAADLADVRKVRIFFNATSGTAEALVADLRSHSTVFDPGFVAVFDDARSDTYTVAKPIMDAYGYRGVIAVPTALVGTSGKMTLTQLQELHDDYGWGMASHSVNHLTMTSLDATSLASELEDSYAYLQTNGLTRDSEHFIYPGGAKNQTVMDATVARYRTGRSIVNNSGVGYEVPFATDRGMLQTCYIIQSVTLATMTGVVDRLVSRGGVSIWSFHTIETTPAGGSVNWPTADFSSLMAYASAAGLRSYTMSDLWPVQGAASSELSTSDKAVAS